MAQFQGWATYMKQQYCAWVRLDPAITFGQYRSLAIALLAPRHLGFPLNVPPAEWPIYVYVCTCDAKYVGADEVPPNQLVIVMWGQLTDYLA
jgi:hypothetical protein